MLQVDNPSYVGVYLPYAQSQDVSAKTLAGLIRIFPAYGPYIPQQDFQFYSTHGPGVTGLNSDLWKPFTVSVSSIFMCLNDLASTDSQID